MTRPMLREVKELAQSHTAELRYDPRSGGVSVSLKHLPLGVFWDIPQQTPQSLGINP